MANRPTLKAQKRILFGRKVKQLRRQHIIPVNIFGKKVKSVAAQLDLDAFEKMSQQVGETGLVDLVIDSEPPRPVLITNIQYDPILDFPVHADFHQVDLTEKVTAHVPVEIIGESPAVKDQGGVLVTAIDEIEVEALPADLPDKFEIDISTLQNIGDSIAVSYLKSNSKVDIKLEPEAVIVLVQAPQVEEVEAPTETALVEGEAAPTTEAPADGGGDAKSE